MITSRHEWLKEYRKDKGRIWITVTLSDARRFYLVDFEEWYEVKEIIEQDKLSVKSIRLQYRSNTQEILFDGCDGAYLVRSITGSIGGDSIDTMTVGKVKGDSVEKTEWVVQGLVVRDEYTQHLSDCFPEALVLWEGLNNLT